MMMDCNHWATLGLQGKIHPWEDNRFDIRLCLQLRISSQPITECRWDC